MPSLSLIIKLIIVLNTWLYYGGLSYAAYNNTYDNKGTTSIGERLYIANCAVCHGEDGNGKTHAANALYPVPKNFTDPAVAAYLTEERMIESVTYGRPNTAMVPWQYDLTKEEIKAVVRFIRERFMKVTGDEKLLNKISSLGWKYTKEEIEKGRILYMKNCSVCHGERGNAATWVAGALSPSPRNFTDPKVAEYLDEKRMLLSIREGRKDTAMVAWKYEFSDNEIKSIIGFIRSTFMKENLESVERKVERMAILSEHADIGDGKKIFDFNCSPCHGLEGDGKGHRSAFIFPKPRKFTDPEEMKGIDENRMIESITHGRPGTMMLAWGGILTDQQIHNVVAYIINEFVKKK